MAVQLTLSNVKVRTFLILAGIVAVVITGISVFIARADQSDAPKTRASVGVVPSIMSIPGVGKDPSVRYYQLQAQQNKQKAESALQSGGSAIPTILKRGQKLAWQQQGQAQNASNKVRDGQDAAITGSTSGGKASSANAGSEQSGKALASQQQAQAKQGSTGQPGSLSGAGSAAGSSPQVMTTWSQFANHHNHNAAKNAKKASLNSLTKPESASLATDGTGAVPASTQTAKVRSNLGSDAVTPAVTAVGTQMQQLLNSWKVVPQSLVTEKKIKTQDSEFALKGTSTEDSQGSFSQLTKTAGSTSTSPVAGNVIKAGTIAFAVLNTAVNSDEPGPVMATVVGTGPLNGAKLLGQLQMPGNDAQKLVLTFSTLSRKQDRNSMSVSAVAIDPDTARTALSSHTDNHYLLRYGSLFASSFMSGFGRAVSDVGTTSLDSSGNSVTSRSKLNSRDRSIIALGQVGQRWGQLMGPTFNRAPTIQVNAGVGLGILFTSDITLAKQVDENG